MHFEDKSLDDTDFQTTLTAAHNAEPGRKLILRGDKKTRYKRVRDLFRICQKIGFPGVSLRINAQESVTVASRGGL